MTKLDLLRKEIDNIDEDIIKMLARRFKIVHIVGEYKKDNDIKPLQPKRWEEVLRKIKIRADSLGVNSNLVEAIWNLIHEESLRIESNQKK